MEEESAPDAPLATCGVARRSRGRSDHDHGCSWEYRRTVLGFGADDNASLLYDDSVLRRAHVRHLLWGEGDPQRRCQSCRILRRRRRWYRLRTSWRMVTWEAQLASDGHGLSRSHEPRLRTVQNTRLPCTTSHRANAYTGTNHDHQASLLGRPGLLFPLERSPQRSRDRSTPTRRQAASLARLCQLHNRRRAPNLRKLCVVGHPGRFAVRARIAQPSRQARLPGGSVLVNLVRLDAVEYGDVARVCTRFVPDERRLVALVERDAGEEQSDGAAVEALVTRGLRPRSCARAQPEPCRGFQRPNFDQPR